MSGAVSRVDGVNSESFCQREFRMQLWFLISGVIASSWTSSTNRIVRCCSFIFLGGTVFPDSMFLSLVGSARLVSLFFFKIHTKSCNFCPFQCLPPRRAVFSFLYFSFFFVLHSETSTLWHCVKPLNFFCNWILSHRFVMVVIVDLVHADALVLQRSSRCCLSRLRHFIFSTWYYNILPLWKTKFFLSLSL